MKDEEASSPQEESKIVSDVLSAVSRRSWDRLDALTDPEIELVITAGADVAPSPNEHVWRSVHVHGTDALQEYLVDLYAALPSLTLEMRTRSDDGTCADVFAEFSGVNSGGVPFDAFAEMQLCFVDGRVRSVTAIVVSVSVGSGLLTEPDQDPRRYFQAFLDGGESTLTSSSN